MMFAVTSRPTLALIFASSLALALTQSGATPARISSHQIAETPESRQLSRQIHQYQSAIQSRDYSIAASGLPTLIEKARSIHRADLEFQARRHLGAAYLGIGRYREALNILSTAKRFARERRDYVALYAICNNLSWVHLKMNNLEAAAELADEAIWASRQMKENDPRPLILRALIYGEAADLQHAGPAFARAIDISMDAGDLNAAATCWNFWSKSLFKVHRLDEAERAAIESYRLRLLHHLPDLEVSERDLGRILAERGDLKSGSRLINKALLSMGSQGSTAPAWVFYRDRGRLRLLEKEARWCKLTTTASRSNQESKRRTLCSSNPAIASTV
jgi:tetratricopeptide (TPR) repeat protein